MSFGIVSIVGAGPGDPELLTRAAVRRLRRADLVLFDALAEPDARRFARRARRLFVGKRAGRPAVGQEAIVRRLIAGARRGLRVVRLKGGDAFVFGRGGGEALALAGVPVTYRGVAAGFVVLTGHAESTFIPLLESLAPNILTLVVLMGVTTRAAVAATLLRVGWRADTPVALMLGASTPAASRWTGTLAQLREVALDDALDQPGTIVVGDVVRLASMIDPGIDRASHLTKSTVPERPTCTR